MLPPPKLVLVTVLVGIGAVDVLDVRVLFVRLEKDCNSVEVVVIVVSVVAVVVGAALVNVRVVAAVTGSVVRVLTMTVVIFGYARKSLQARDEMCKLEVQCPSMILCLCLHNYSPSPPSCRYSITWPCGASRNTTLRPDWLTLSWLVLIQTRLHTYREAFDQIGGH